jgi:hypothetical protein
VRHHVLLIGIDAYDGGGMLTGCVNDIDAVQRLLVDRVGVPRERIRRLAAPRGDAPHETDVPEAPPTLDNLRAELARLGTDEVAPGDRVFVYYSGHGTQCLVDAGGRRFSREALLPKDKKRGAEYRLLFDWELNASIARIAARTPAVTVVLDCCNAAGATRGPRAETETARERFWPTPGVQRVDAGAVPPGDRVRGLAAGLGAVARCQVIAACRDDERARESAGEGETSHGELTRALVGRLRAVPPADLPELRWGRIWRGVEAAVREANPRQSPWLSGGFGRRVFGLGPDEDGDPGFAVVPAAAGYRLDVGTLAGVTPEARIAVYGSLPPTFPPLESGEDLAARQGLLRVTRADRAACEAVALAPFVLPDAPRGRLVRPGDAARLRVALAPDDASLAAKLAGSALVERVAASEAELTLARRADGGWALTDDVHGTGEQAGEPTLAIVPADRLGHARAVVEHYHGYVQPLRMARACRDLPSLLRLWLLDCAEAAVAPAAAQDPDLPQVEPGRRAPYELGAGDRVCFVVENAAEVTLSVTLLDCAASGRVLLLGEKRLPRRSRHVFWLGDTLGEPFAASLPDDRAVGLDRIVAIGTTRPDVSLGFLARGQSFAEVLTPVERGRGSLDERGGAPAESWTAAVTAVRIARRRDDLDRAG